MLTLQRILDLKVNRWEVVLKYTVMTRISVPGRLSNFSIFFYLDAYLRWVLKRSRHKIWEGQERQFKRYTSLQLLSRFRFPAALTLMLFSTSAFKNCFTLIQFSNKYYNIRISALPGGLNRIWALIRLCEVYLGAYSRGSLKEAGQLFESLWYVTSYEIFCSCFLVSCWV